MTKEKYTDSNYIPDENTSKEIEALYKKDKNLSNLKLSNASLQGLYLVDAKMKKCELKKVNFENASMYGVDLSESNLFKANFENANLKDANLQNCNLLGVNFNNTQLKNVYWGKDSKVINELDAEKALSKGDYTTANKKYKQAEDIYRNIKISLQNQTLSEDTGIFFIREMISKRKQFKKFSAARIGSKIIEITTGYGEKLSNIIFTITGIIFFCMVLYGIEGVKYGDPIHGDRIIGFFSDDLQEHGLINTLGNLFYFSIVVYSTVGFGEMLPIGPIGKATMIFEGLVGGLVLAILIIALYKKTMDR
tara:strand:- start:4929 stop:5849 length:921 start_codon:yes stop_codon:yes gene_type:complete